MARRHLNWITVGRCRAAGGRDDDDGWRGGALCILGDGGLCEYRIWSQFYNERRLDII